MMPTLSRNYYTTTNQITLAEIITKTNTTSPNHSGTGSAPSDLSTPFLIDCKWYTCFTPMPQQILQYSVCCKATPLPTETTTPNNQHIRPLAKVIEQRPHNRLGLPSNMGPSETLKCNTANCTPTHLPDIQMHDLDALGQTITIDHIITPSTEIHTEIASNSTCNSESHTLEPRPSKLQTTLHEPRRSISPTLMMSYGLPPGRQLNTG